MQPFDGPIDCNRGGSSSGDAFVTELDPTGTHLIHSTYLGGSGDDRGWAIAIAEAGDAYIAGATSSTDFPVTAGAFQTQMADINGTGFVAKLDATGSHLDYATYLGGSQNADNPLSIGIDSTGAAYIAGRTASADFPVTPGAAQTAFGGKIDAFVTKLSADGTSLTYSTFVGGSGYECVLGCHVAVTAAGAAVVGLDTDAADAATTPSAFQTSFAGAAGDIDGYVAELDHSGDSLSYATYLGHTGRNFVNGVAIGPSGSIYVAADAQSADFPTTAGAYQPARAGAAFDNAVISVIEPNGSGASDLRYSTYLGGNNSDYPMGIAVDTGGRAYVAGVTSSSTFPTVQAVQSTCGCFTNANSPDAFAAVLNPAGSGAGDLVFSTFLGGTGTDMAAGVVVGPSGDLIVAGTTNSPLGGIRGASPQRFPTTKGAFQQAYAGPKQKSRYFDFYDGDAFVARINLNS